MSEKIDQPRDRTSRIICSALWAAAGDALGWTTELGGVGAVRARTGVERVDQPVDWVRRIGGRAGVQVSLPAGTYSDDTQLRLAVCRSIRGDGAFDAEAFARVELTAWQGYSLGAGNGSKAAAANLAKRGVNWFSNFFETKDQKYTAAGGNGAAMRVQPHAWLKSDHDELLLAVMRDALVTHGHPHGFGGAILHALSVSKAMKGELFGPHDFEEVIASLRCVPSIVGMDRQLDAFWRPAWETMAGHSLEYAMEALIEELRNDLGAINAEFHAGFSNGYQNVLNKLQLTTDRFRGSGLKTALAASVLSWFYRDEGPDRALIMAANALGSDTDTIATMAGAILGAVTNAPLEWTIQDRDYIVGEARRIAAIASGQFQDSFSYPDLARWQPPTSQSDSIAMVDGSFVVVGLGRAEPFNEEYRAGDAIWQWMALPFGQTVFAKRRIIAPEASVGQLPGQRRVAKSPKDSSLPPRQSELLLEGDQALKIEGSSPRDRVTDIENWPSIDDVTNDVIASGFDPLTIGQAFQYILERRCLIEDVVSFSSIIGKAQLARMRKRRR